MDEEYFLLAYQGTCTDPSTQAIAKHTDDGPVIVIPDAGKDRHFAESLVRLMNNGLFRLYLHRDTIDQL